MGTYSWERINPPPLLLIFFVFVFFALACCVLEAGDFAAARICGRFLVAAERLSQ
jgi:hypothetical protein